MEQSRIDLTQAEWQVMECLWEQAPRTGREAAEYMARRTGWSRSTTLTLLQRLEDKGAVSSREEGRKRYSPRCCGGRTPLYRRRRTFSPGCITAA